jgi:hypothetical protein
VSESESDRPSAPRRRWAGALSGRANGAESAPPTVGGPGLPPALPACPEGCVTGAPDFIGVGAQRCGTTRWFDLITAHPEVAAPASRKELHFFDRFHSGGYKPGHTERYHQYFPRPAHLKAGEWTPYYMSAPWIAPLLAAAAPEARLLVALRDPLERQLSGLQLEGERQRQRGEQLTRSMALEQFVRGLYHQQIVRLLRHFDRSRILILQYERCTREPLAELRRTYEFLGLEDVEFVPSLDAHPLRQPEKPELDAPTREAYLDAYREDVGRLVQAAPEIDIGLWPNFAHLAERSAPPSPAAAGDAPGA